MQYVGRAIGSVSKTWNSINPATLSGAIDVIVVEQENGDLSCSPFHVRFGKFSLLRPSQKKVEFSVNGDKVDLPMKLGEGGEAFFVFETEGAVPKDLITSPVISPSSSPSDSPKTPDQNESVGLQEPEFLDINDGRGGGGSGSGGLIPTSPGKALSVFSRFVGGGGGVVVGETDSDGNPVMATVPHTASIPVDDRNSRSSLWNSSNRSQSPPLSREQAIEKVKLLTKKLTDVNIPSKISDNGDIILDITGYKSGEEDEKHSDQLVRKILYDEFGLQPEGLESIIALDDEGNLRISPRDDEGFSHTIKQSAFTQHHFASDPNLSITAEGDGGSTSTGTVVGTAGTVDTTGTDTADIASSAPTSPITSTTDTPTHYVKTLRLTSEQLKSLNLLSGANDISFTVNRATCTARIFYWSCKDPIVISDIDGTITKSDALGHVLTMLGRDWTHLGVGKLFTDIANNGYNIMYLTARSVGQADSTRYYLKSVDQNGYKLPEGPVILSPDRTMAALRREVIMKKPEVFKMACLRDIQNLYGSDREETPFYAGFGNRITDALSYRSVGVPSSKIFTINANSEVHMELLELAGYKSSYVSITQLVDHFFPPVLLGSQTKTEQSYTDVNYWRDPIPDLSDLDEEEETSNIVFKKAPLENIKGNSPAVEQKVNDLINQSFDQEDDDEEEEDGDEDYDEEEDEDYEEEEDDEDDNYEYEDDEDVDEDEDGEEGEEEDEDEDEQYQDFDQQEDLDNDLLQSPSSPPPPSSSHKLTNQSDFIKASEALQTLQL